MKVSSFVFGVVFAGFFIANASAQPPAAAPANPAAPVVDLAPQPVSGPIGKDSARPVPRLQTEFCVACHGAQWEGVRAPSMLDDVWAHGSSDAEITRSIRDGWPANIMPAFGAVLSPLEIRGLVISIREARAKASRVPPAAPQPIDGQIVKSQHHTFKIEVVTKDVRTPWAIAFLPDGRFLVSERATGLRIVETNGTLGPPIAEMPTPWVRQDGGYFDVAVHPDYARNGWVYVSFSEAGPERGTSSTRVVRGRIRDGKFVDQETIFQAAPEFVWQSNTHYGSRFLFDRAGFLYFSIGDRGRMNESQNLASPYGKLHRIHDDGRIPTDNPFVNHPTAFKSIWSYGHRNQQGIAQHPVNGQIWADEHGPRGGDELNLIAKAHNYGWPVITYGMNDNGTPITDLTSKEGMDQPITYWTPSIAVSALEFYTGNKFPKWKNQLFMAALVSQQLIRMEIDAENQVVTKEVLFQNFGRVREVVTGPDGNLYVTLNSQFGDSPGQIIRLVPVETP